MSKPGEWKTGQGVTMRITDMDADHLRNSMRLLYRKLVRPAFTAPPAEAPPVANTWRSQTSNDYYEDKLVELAEEAQRRNFIPQQCTYDQLLTIVGEWEREAVARRAAWERRQAQQNAPLPILPASGVPVNVITVPFNPINQDAVAPALTPAQLDAATRARDNAAREADIRRAAQKRANESLRRLAYPEKVERNISFEL